jgi:hypothetical protein
VPGWLSSIGIWLSRATGIGYQPFPPISAERAFSFARRSDALVNQVEQLERELRRRGELPH